MRAYGLPRNDDVANPDIADIREFGLKSSTGRFREKGGDYRAYNRNARLKARVRRVYKRRARAEGKSAVSQERTTDEAED